MSSTQKEDLFPSAASTSATAVNGNSISLPARSKNFIGHLSVPTINGATTVTALIQHSPDSVNWYTYLTFTPVVGSTGKQAVYPTNQPIFPYVRSTFTLSGVTKSATVEIKLFFENFS